MKRTKPGSCQACGNKRLWLHRHHIVPRSQGGTDSPDNFQYICANCHEDAHGGPYSGKAAHTAAAIQKQVIGNKATWNDPVKRLKRLMLMHKSGHGEKSISKQKREQWENGTYTADMFKKPKKTLSKRYRESNRLLDRARKVTPGASQTLSKQPARFPVGAFPLFARGGKGSRMIDVDGNEFIDWICALGAITLGYDHPIIMKAVRESIGHAQLPMPCREEEQLAQRLIEKMPAAEAVRFTRTGTEACMAAVRIARMATKREHIITMSGSYHGWADWYIASREPHCGVPEVLTKLIQVCPYDDLNALRGLLTAETACIIMEPTLMTVPDPQYLGAVIRLAHANGSLVIWDENILGYRLALGGGSEFYHAVPDLAIYGKAMGGGIPIACVVGKTEVMAHAEIISGTFLGDRSGLASALAVLDVYEREPIIERLHETGRQLQEAYNTMGMGLGLPTRCIGPAWHPTIVWECEESSLPMSLFLQETARRGVLFHPSGFNTSAALSHDDVLRSIDACWATLKVMKKSDWKKMLKGKQIEMFAWRQREQPIQSTPFARRS